jgi:hypothetical protein
VQSGLDQTQQHDIKNNQRKLDAIVKIQEETLSPLKK